MIRRKDVAWLKDKGAYQMKKRRNCKDLGKFQIPPKLVEKVERMTAESDAEIGITEDKLTHKEIVAGMRALRKKIKADKMSVRQMIEEGRRF